MNDVISYQLAGNGTNGLSQGALIHFAEIGNLTNQSASDICTVSFVYGGN